MIDDYDNTIWCSERRVTAVTCTSTSEHRNAFTVLILLLDGGEYRRNMRCTVGNIVCEPTATARRNLGPVLPRDDT